MTSFKWRDKHTPFSIEFDDVYYPPGQGVAAAEYVFLQQTSLKEIFDSDRKVVVGELGFGTGLNFLAALN